jgi:hypothetical protein
MGVSISSIVNLALVPLTVTDDLSNLKSALNARLDVSGGTRMRIEVLLNLSIIFTEPSSMGLLA